jgi:hypothetical protein
MPPRRGVRRSMSPIAVCKPRPTARFWDFALQEAASIGSTHLLQFGGDWACGTGPVIFTRGRACPDSSLTLRRREWAGSSRRPHGRRFCGDHECTLKRDSLLEGLKDRLLAPDLVAVFVNAIRAESKRQRDALEAEWAGRERKAAENRGSRIRSGGSRRAHAPAARGRLTGVGSSVWSGSSKA